MFSQACACIGEKCSGIALCTWGWRERCWAHLSHLLPVQLVLGPDGPRPGLLRAGGTVPPNCVLGLSVPALKQLYILSGASWSLQHILPGLAQFTKWSVYACHTVIKFFPMESQLYSHLSACRCLLTGSLLVQESTKQKAVDEQWTPRISPGTQIQNGHQHLPRSLWSWGCWQQTRACSYQIPN